MSTPIGTSIEISRNEYSYIQTKVTGRKCKVCKKVIIEKTRILVNKFTDVRHEQCIWGHYYTCCGVCHTSWNRRDDDLAYYGEEY